MNSTDHFKEILSRKFRDFEELPPENDWELFKSKFDLKISRNRLYHRLSYMSAIVIVSVVATIIILHINNSHRISPAQNLTVKYQHQKSRVSETGNIINRNAVNTSPEQTPKQVTVSNPQTPMRSDDHTLNIQLKRNNNAGKDHTDTIIKKSAIVVKEIRLDKVPSDTQPDLLNTDFIKNDHPGNITKPEKDRQVKINDNKGPVINNAFKTDTTQAYKGNIQPSNSDFATPAVNDEKNVPDVVNVITPNGDGINDMLVVKNIDLFAPCKINIYDSWGEKIYSSSNYQNNWDGISKGKLVSEGTYYYVLETKDGKVYKGAVNVLK